MDLDYSAYYRLFHTEDPDHVRGMVEYERKMLAPHIDDLPKERAVDLGSGMGFAVLALNELGFDAHGVEIDRAQVEAAHRLGAAPRG